MHVEENCNSARTQGFVPAPPMSDTQTTFNPNGGQLMTRGEKLYIDDQHNVSIKESLEENSPSNSYILSRRIRDEDEQTETTLNHNDAQKRLQ